MLIGNSSALREIWSPFKSISRSTREKYGEKWIKKIVLALTINSAIALPLCCQTVVVMISVMRGLGGSKSKIKIKNK